MKLRLPSVFLTAALCAAVSTTLHGQQPQGVVEALRGICSQPANHTSFTFDHNMLQAAEGYLDDGSSGKRTIAALNSITVENYHYHEPVFYLPESMSALVAAYNAAGWKHLVNQNASPRDSASPHAPITDLWLHFQGGEIEDVTVLVRGQREMNVIEVSGVLSPLDLVHLSGHFGIPKVDPNAVMVPAAPGK
jgi:hypothetical protein